MGRLQDRVAVVTGGASGIGNAITTQFHEEGAAVVIADIQREPRLREEQSVFEKVDDPDDRLLFCETDVTDEDDVDEIVSTTVAEFDGIDILVNNAGVFNRFKLHDTPLDEWKLMIGVNLTGTYLMSKASIPYLLESDNGKIVNISSSAGIHGTKESAAYSASKGGVISLTKQMAVDYAEDKLNVNAIAPGVTKTAQNREWRENDQELIEDWRAGRPWPEFAQPDDIANATTFLASGDSDFITGHILVIDGGETIQ